MKTVAILIGHNAGNKVKPFYIPSSVLLQEIFEKHGIQIIRVSTKHLMKNGKFGSYFIFNKEGNSIIIRKPIKPDILWQRISDGHTFIHTSLSPFYPIVPTYTTTALAADKYDIYMHTKDFTPKTELIEFFLNSKKIQDQFSEKLVLKPIRANGGIGISFIDKKDLLKKKKGNYDGLGRLYLVQEFKDFGEGYPGLITGNHDLRLTYVGNKLSFSIIRQPKKGSLKSNIASGGSQKNIDLEKIPQEVLQLAKKIKKALFLDKHSIYSLDFAYCKAEKKWYLLEMNYSPGTWFPENDKKWAIKYFTDLSSFFKRIIAKKITH